jgi:hypothetical protein
LTIFVEAASGPGVNGPHSYRDLPQQLRLYLELLYKRVQELGIHVECVDPVQRGIQGIDDSLIIPKAPSAPSIHDGLDGFVVRRRAARHRRTQQQNSSAANAAGHCSLSSN